MADGVKKRIFAQRISRLRDERALTQAELGRKVGVSGTCIWNWECGNTYPRPTAMRRLAQVLGTTVEFLNGGGESAEKHSNHDSNHKQSLADVILEARQNVSAAAGLQLDKVRVILDWGD